MRQSHEIDWLSSPDVEVVPGKMGGRPVIKGTRIEPDTVMIEEDYGRSVEQTHESYPTLSVETIRSIRDFAHRHQLVP